MPILCILLVIAISITISSAIGWIANIVQLVHIIHDPVTALFILKCVGIFAAPLGVILGYVGMF